MSGEVDPDIARLKRLPPRLRTAHLAALQRSLAHGSPRAAEFTRYLAVQSACTDGRDG
jgi:hypothetical protein